MSKEKQDTQTTKTKYRCSKPTEGGKWVGEESGWNNIPIRTVCNWHTHMKENK